MIGGRGRPLKCTCKNLWRSGATCRRHNVTAQDRYTEEEIAKREGALDKYLQGIGLPPTTQLSAYTGPPVELTYGILLASRCGDDWSATRMRLLQLLRLPDSPHRIPMEELKTVILRLNLEQSVIKTRTYCPPQMLKEFYGIVTKVLLDYMPLVHHPNVTASRVVPFGHGELSRGLSHSASTVSLSFEDMKPSDVDVKPPVTPGHDVSRMDDTLDVTSLLPTGNFSWPVTSSSVLDSEDVKPPPMTTPTSPTFAVTPVLPKKSKRGHGSGRSQNLLIRDNTEQGEGLRNARNLKRCQEQLKVARNRVSQLKAEAVSMSTRTFEAEQQLINMKKVIEVWDTRSAAFTDHCVEHMRRFSKLGVDPQKLPEALECAASFAGVKLDTVPSVGMCKRATRTFN